MKTVLLLTISNIFMTFAWYGHLKHKNSALWIAVIASWGVAFFEYLFQVPANRIGAESFSLPQLKIMQECITIAVFTVISWTFFDASLKWNNIVSLALIMGAVYFTFCIPSKP